jgi:TorA maturation chaperone TorD
MLSRADIARGRGRAYALLAELVSRGPTEATLEPMRASESLARALDSYPGQSLDEAAADHQFVFGLSVPPHEGAFLDPRGEVGGPLTDRLRDAYAELGVAHDPRGEGAEHLATQLRALGFASASQAKALDEGREADADELGARMRTFLDRHLLRWLPSFAATVRGGQRALPSAMVAQIVDVVLDHRSELGPAAELDLDFALEGEPLDLDDDSVGVREIAAALSVPSRVGLALSRDDIASVGRRHRVPRGFGERRTLIHNLLRSAVSLGALPATLEEIRHALASRRDALSALQAADVPGLARLTAPWLERIEQTDTALARLARESRNAERPDASP